jgi:hypothetical protein
LSRVAQAVVSLASAALPATTRERYREQWLADLRDAHELGLSEASVARGAVGFALIAVPREVLRAEFRASFGWVSILAAVVVVALPLLEMLLRHGFLAGTSTAPSNAGVFATAVDGFVPLLFPVLLMLVGCFRLFQELGDRFVANTRTRVRIESYVYAKLLVAMAVGFVVFFTATFLAFVTAFVIWPAIGNPGVDASGLLINGHPWQAEDEYRQYTYSQLLAAGPMPFGLFYSAWVGLGAATCVALGMACLLLVKRPVIGLAMPFLLLVAQHAAVILLGQDRLSVINSLFPFGYTQVPVAVGMAPLLVLVVLVAGLWVVLLRRLSTLEALT